MRLSTNLALPPCHVASANDDAFWCWRRCNAGYFQGRIPALGTPDGADSPSNQIVLGAPAGSAIFLGGLTPHASAPNRSARWRRTLIVAYRAADRYSVIITTRTAHSEALIVSGAGYDVTGLLWTPTCPGRPGAVKRH